MQTFLQDIRYAVRVLKKAPGFSLVAIIAIAMGISANTTIFSSTDATLLHPFSFPNQDRLVMLHEQNLAAGIKRSSVSPGNYIEMTRRGTTMQELVAMNNTELDFSVDGKPERYNGYSATANFFDAFGVGALLGRTFTREEGTAGRENVVVLKYDFWQKRFGGDASIVGKTVQIDRKAFTVIGVMPKDFDFPYGGCQMYVPKVFDREAERDYGKHYLLVMGLLKPSVTIAQAGAEMSGIAEQLAREFPDANAGRTIIVADMIAHYTRGARMYVPVMIGSVIFVLLIACANVANLQLVRAASRRKEIAVRLALGASRTRILRYLLTESILLSLLGGVIGLVLSSWAIEALAQGIPEAMSRYIPGWNHLGINGRVLLFTFLISVAAGILFGLAPALQALKADLNETLKEGGGKGTDGKSSRGLTRNGLIVLEIALSLVLLVGAGLMVRSFVEIMRTDFGIEPDNVISLWVSLPEADYPSEEKRRNFLNQLLRDVEALPNVAQVGAVNNLPMGGSSNISNFQIEGQPPFPKESEPHADVRLATPRYFDAIGTKLRRGRLFNEGDAVGTTPVAVINEALAARFFPGRNPIGARMSFGGPTVQIVGIVSNVMNDDIDDPAEPGAYFPYSQRTSWDHFTLVARAQSDPTQLVGAIRDRIAALDPNLAVSNIKTLDQAVFERTSPKRMMMWMMIIFGLMALAMAAMGTYAVMAYAAAQRTREIGIRVALGAQPRDILRLILGQGLRVTTLGIALGLAGAFGLSRALGDLLYGVSATDPVTFLGIPAVLIAVSLLACFLPARRATRVDPMIVLRDE